MRDRPLSTKRGLRFLGMLLASLVLAFGLALPAFAESGGGSDSGGSTSSEFDIIEGEVLASLPEGTLVSAVPATVPDEYGPGSYSSAICMDVELTGVADDASIDVRLTSFGNNGEDASHLVSPVGFTKADTLEVGGELMDAILNGALGTLSEEETSFEDGKLVFVHTVQLSGGSAQLVAFYYREDLEAMGPDSGTPTAIVLNLHTDGGTHVDPHDMQPGGPVLVKATPSFGQFENENALYGLVAHEWIDYIGDYSTYLIVPNGIDSVATTLTFISDDFAVTVNGQPQGPISSENTLTVELNAAPKQWDNTLSEASKNEIRAVKGNEETVYTIFVVNQRFDDLPDAVIDYLCVGSQYTNDRSAAGDYGTRPIRSLVGSNYSMGGNASGPVSLGNFGGFITYYYEDPIIDDPSNPYGIDFIVFGNAYRGNQEFGEPGQVWVSEDGDNWYALAGGMHYEDYANWNYSIAYSKNDDGTATIAYPDGTTQSYGSLFYPDPLKYPYYSFSEQDKSSMTFTGICFESGDEQDTSGSGMARHAGFGYADQGSLGTRLSGDTFQTEEFVTIDGATTQMLTEAAYEKLARNIAENPYAEYPSGDDVGRFSVPTDGMDLAWAVDADGQPVDVSNKEFHYIKIVTATNIVNPSLGEKSTEVNMVRVAQAADSAVGKTSAPAKITVDGVDVPLEDGKFVYDDVVVDGAFKVAVDAPEGANVYINNNRATSVDYDMIPDHKIIRVIVQEGEQEPAIYILNLVEGELPEPIAPGWHKDDAGEWHYYNADGTMLTEGWAKDSKGWCYLDADGNITKGKWIKDTNGEWYYLKANGYMAANEWAKDSKGWMYMDSSGKITKSKWVKYNGSWYYLKADGYMATGTQTINGKTYKFASSGKWIS